MTVTDQDLGVFNSLADAIGLTIDGSPNPSWFSDPIGSASAGQNGLSTIMHDDDQREALLEFVDEVLGPPDRDTEGQQVWVPLFRDSGVTVFAVVEPVPGSVRVGVGVEYESSTDVPSVSLRVHAALFQLEREGGTAPTSSGPDPDWLLIGRPGGTITATLDATLDASTPVPGQAHLGGAAVSVTIPTSIEDDFAVSLVMRQLQLPGAVAPRDLTLDINSLDELDDEAFELLVALLQAQAETLDPTDTATRAFAALTGMLGLRAVPGIPPLPLADLTDRGTAALVDWIETLLSDDTARAAWIGELAVLTGGTPDPATGSVSFSAGDLTASVALSVVPSPGGAPTLVVSLELGYRIRSGAEVTVSADLLRLDTGTGAVEPLPRLIAEAVFGTAAGGPALLTGDPGVGAIRTGLRLIDGRPAFSLTAHDVVLGGVDHALLDLSSPESALDAATGLIDDALTAALESLGRPGELAARLIGFDPPTGVAGIDAADLLTDPLAAAGRYWAALIANRPALAEIVTDIRELIDGSTAAVAGSGTPTDPWLIPIVVDVALRIWAESQTLAVDLVASFSTPVLDQLEAAASLRAALARIDPTAGTVRFLDEVAGTVTIGSSGAQRAELDLGPASLYLDSAGAEVAWARSGGLRVDLIGEGLAISVDAAGPDAEVKIPLPTIASDGTVSFEPDWDDIQLILGRMLRGTGLPLVDAGVDLLGWAGGGSGAVLSLAGLVTDPETALRRWLADIVLNCRNVSTALVPLAALLSGFQGIPPAGYGSEQRPYRCPVAGEARAPGLAAWFDPPCPFRPPRYDGLPGRRLLDEVPGAGDVVTALQEAAAALPDVADLLVARERLDEGIGLLAQRFAGTDGIIGIPAALPTGVTGVDLSGFSYRELVALGSTGELLLEVLDPVPTAVLHVGCEAVWADDPAGGTGFDLRAGQLTADQQAATLPAAGPGLWSVSLPTPAAARAARPDRGDVGEQAARLTALLAARTGPVTIVGYGPAAAAAIRVAGLQAAVTEVITVGGPWGPVATSALATGLSGDALRLLAQLRRPDVDDWAEELLAGEATPLVRARHLVERAARAAAGTEELPTALAEPMPAGTTVRAVFGSLTEDDALLAIAALVDDGLQHRYDELADAVGSQTPPEVLHLGADIPVVSLDLAGLIIGGGTTVELCRFERGDDGGLQIHPDRVTTVDVQLAVRDGWLVGGPGATARDVEVRWMSVRLRLPGDGSDATAALTLHESTVFGIERSSWQVDVNADPTDAITGTLPEVHIVLDEVVTRLIDASTDLAQLLTGLGLVRDGGYDPAGLERLLYDTSTTIGAALEQRAGELAAAVRGLAGLGGTGSELTWTAGAATVGVDLAARSVTASVAHDAVDLPRISVSLTAADQVTFTAAIGTLDPVAGGMQLRGQLSTGAAGELVVLRQRPGDTVAERIPLLPATDTAGLVGLLTTAVPAVLARSLIDYCRGSVSPDTALAIDTLLETLGLLGPPDETGRRTTSVPVALFSDPGAWLRHAASGWVGDPLGSAVALLDTVRPLVTTGPITPGEWRISNEVAIAYQVTGGRLDLTARVQLSADLGTGAAAASVSTLIDAGIGIDATGTVTPALAVEVETGGSGIALAVAPGITVALVRSGQPPLAIYPAGAGIGELLTTGALMAVPVALNALLAERSSTTASLERDVARALYGLGSALDLLVGDEFSEARITAFAADPAAALTARMPQLAATGVAELAAALDPTGAVVVVSVPGAGMTRLAFGGGIVALTLDGGTAGPAVELSGQLNIPDVGPLVIERVRLSADGVEVALRLGPGSFEVAGGLVLRPVVAVSVGASSAGISRLVAVGLATDAGGQRSVEVRWSLDASPPRLVVVDRGLAGAGDPEITDAQVVATEALAVVTGMAVPVLVEALDPLLGNRSVAALQGVLFTDTAGSRELDAQLFADLTDPEELLVRVLRLAFNLADAGISLTIDGTVEIGFTKRGDDAGIFVNLAGSGRFAISTGDPTVELEVDADWIRSSTDPGLSLYLVRRNGDRYAPRVSFGIGGLGIRVSKLGGPLLDLGALAIDAIAVHVLAETDGSGVGAGIHVQLDGLAIAPSGAGGENSVANGIMSDAGAEAGPGSRPAFSPSLAVQQPLGETDPSVSLRAGDPPGPWWLVVQRELGPLYLEQFGFDSTEQDGAVVGISLLFDGRISLFGMVAQVDQLSLSWLGGDVFDPQSWAVDLQGLAISADLSGAYISGGLLRTETDGSIGYLGMLVGRFGVYGLSMFGGYTDDHGTASFFVFGAVNGPIGGPPAFFVTGIGGGLGINRGLRVPDDLSKFNEYPFIKALDPAAGPSEDPMDELRALSEYFPPEPGNFWFAAGISFTSFALVDGVAVVSVSFGNGFELTLFGLARMALPRPGAALVSIELGLLARFSTSEGLFLIQAQLTDNSWLLYPDVRLTGGFAFATWWKGELSGQFVLTLGGYHPNFQRAGYPAVPRLGLTWQVSSEIVVKGGAYFALTSEALMAGVDVEVSADFGFVWAKVTFGAHAIVYFDPFWYEAEAYATISAGLKLKTIFGTIRLSISIGANVKVAGPDFHGRATFEIGPCDVSVPFGSTREIEGRTVDWSEFIGKYLEDAGSGRARAISAVTGAGTLPASTDGEASAPSSDGSAGRPFEVFAEFELMIVTTVPVTDFELGADDVPVTPMRSDGAATSLGISPMDASGLNSKLRIRLQNRVTGVWRDRNAELAMLVKNMQPEGPDVTGASYGVEAFPIGVWGEPADADLPDAPLPKGDVVTAGARLRLVASADLTGQAGPQIDYYRVEAARLPLPLSATGDARAEMIAAAGVLELPRAVDASGALHAADALLFDRPAVDLPSGLVASAPRSSLARAGFAGGRSAPPLFGTLTGGLARANGPDTVGEELPAKPAVRAPAPREPFVAGYLTSGSRVAARGAATTVADKRIKRRPAPSLGSVRGRLGRQLPIRLSVRSLPSATSDTTVLARVATPRTDVPGSVRSYRGARLASPLARTVVAGLGGATRKSGSGPAARSQSQEASGPRAGDIAVLRLPDPAIDVDHTERPKLAVEGQARVVILGGNGGVRFDADVADDAIEVPPLSALVVVQADGTISPGEGLAGWHGLSRVARLGSRAALGSGCVLTTEGSRSRGPVAWLPAGRAVRDAAAVTTRFAADVRAVAVVLRAADIERLDALGIEVHGGRRVPGPGGLPRAPIVVQRGANSLLVFGVEPDETDDTAGIAVRVVAGGDRQLAGVLGGSSTPDDLADLLAERGPVAVTGRMLSPTGDGCSLRWTGVPAHLRGGG